MVEYLGYLASILVAVSITMKGGVYFRLLNMAGSACFLIYGLFIGSLPVAAINAYGIGINMFHLFRLRAARVKGTAEGPGA